MRMEVVVLMRGDEIMRESEGFGMTREKSARKERELGR